MRPAARPNSRLRRLRPLAFGAVALAAVGVACAVESPDRSTGPRADARASAASAGAAPSATPPAGRAGAAAEFFEFQVDEPASSVPGSITLRYPDALRAAGKEGKVIAQFVVDATGRVDPSTVKVLESTHPDFSAAAQAAVLSARFRPARVGGQAVRQLVQLPFGFTLNP